MTVNFVDQIAPNGESEEMKRKWEEKCLQIIENVTSKGLLAKPDRAASGLTASMSSGTALFSHLAGRLIFTDRQNGVEIKQVNLDYKMVSYKANSQIPYQTYLKSDTSVERGVIEEALYAGACSVFPVIAERSSEGVFATETQTDSVLNDRLGNSMLVVSPLKDISDISWLSQNGETRIGKSIPAQDFIAVLLPATLKRQFAERLPSDKVNFIGVPDKKSRVYTNMEGFPTPSSTESGKLLQVPDYEGELIKLIQSSNVPLFIHGVRLPTKTEVT